MTTNPLPAFGMPDDDGSNPTPTPTPAPQQPTAPQPPTPAQPPTGNWTAPVSPAPMQPPAPPQFMQRPPTQQFMQRPAMPQQQPAQITPAAPYGSPAPAQEVQARGTTGTLDITLLGLAVILPFVCMLTLYGSPFVMMVLTICSGLRIKHFKDQNQKAPHTTWTALWWAAAMVPITLVTAMMIEDWSLDHMTQG